MSAIDRQRLKDAESMISALSAELELRKELEGVWDMLHFSCDNPDHREAYRRGAVALGYTEEEDA